MMKRMYLLLALFAIVALTAQALPLAEASPEAIAEAIAEAKAGFGSSIKKVDISFY